MRETTQIDGANKAITSIKPKKNSWKSDLPFYLILAFPIVLVFLMSYLPMSGLLLAFKDWNARKGIWGSEWVGFDNFVTLFKTPALTKAIFNTLWINIVTQLFVFPAPIILALLINEVLFSPFKKVVQTVSYLPHFLSWAAVTGIVNSLLSEYGLVNSFLYNVFGATEGQMLLETEGAFLPVYVITNVWKEIGWGSIIYLSAICTVSEELYEAAEIDGAGRFKQVMHVTLPTLLPVVGIQLILKMGTLFGSNFELMYGLQNPIAWKDEVIATVIYKNGLKGGEYSVSTALSLMQGAVALLLTFGANWVSKKVSDVSMW